MFRIALSLLMGLLLSASLGAESVRPAALRVIVPEDAAPMAYRDETGRLTGFSVEIARALCEEIRVVCHFDVATQHELLDRLLQGKADMAASSVFEAPEIRRRVSVSPRSPSRWKMPTSVTTGVAGLTGVMKPLSVSETGVAS